MPTTSATAQEFLLSTEAELSRAYAGMLAPREVIVAAEAALEHAAEHPRRVRRADNPVGYLFRIGRAQADEDQAVDWRDPDGDVVSALRNERLVKALKRLPTLQANVAWLVRACGWTHVQVGEALGVSPAIVVDAASSAASHLRRELALSDAELTAEVGALADTRVSLLAALTHAAASALAETEGGDAPAPAGAGSSDTAATTTAHPLRRSALTATVLVALIGFATVLFALARPGPTSAPDPTPGPDPTSAPTAQAAASTMSDRGAATVPAWSRPLDDTSLAGTFALARVGDTSQVQVADAARTQHQIVLEDGTITTMVEQLSAMEALAIDDNFDEHFGDGSSELAGFEVKTGPSWRLWYTTGTGAVDGTPAAWTVGVVESAGERWTFAHNADLPMSEAQPGRLPIAARIDAIREFLTLADVIVG